MLAFSFVSWLSWAAKIHSISSSKYSVFWCRQKSFVIPWREKHKMTFCLIYACNNVLSHPPEALFFSTLWTNIEFKTINMILLVRFHKCKTYINVGYCASVYSILAKTLKMTKISGRILFPLSWMDSNKKVSEYPFAFGAMVWYFMSLFVCLLQFTHL